ncbi:hypothetical protein OROGR_017305 [Orobanche gracilis]
MDSGNSGSPQSSDGGDESYESRAAAGDDSIFINTHPPQPLFDPYANYTQQFHHPNPNHFNNPNAAWAGSTSVRPDPILNHHDAINFSMHSSVGADENNPGDGTSTSAAVRNPKKRSRASRRAPTTVLTTDTTNFRSMVQEFTGIPAPPFGDSSFLRSNRLDNLFGSRSASFDVAAAAYLRRPFPQQTAPTPPFLVSSSATNNITTSLPTPNNLLLNLNSSNESQNPLFSSLLQSNTSKFIFSNSSVTASRPGHSQGPFEIPAHLKTGPGLDGFGPGGHGNHVAATLNGIPGLIFSDQATARNDRPDNTGNENAATWRSDDNNSNNNGVGTHSERDGYNNQAQMKPVHGGFDFTGSSSNFPGEKGPENIGRTIGGDQGMVESWINSSEKK